MKVKILATNQQKNSRRTRTHRLTVPYWSDCSGPNRPSWGPEPTETGPPECTSLLLDCKYRTSSFHKTPRINGLRPSARLSSPHLEHFYCCLTATNPITKPSSSGSQRPAPGFFCQPWTPSRSRGGASHVTEPVSASGSPTPVFRTFLRDGSFVWWSIITAPLRTDQSEAPFDDTVWWLADSVACCLFVWFSPFKSSSRLLSYYHYPESSLQPTFIPLTVN